MRKNELTQLRRQVNAEIARREKINQYLESKDVLEYIKLIGGSTQKKDLENVREMLLEILKNFQVKETNGIYVCTKAYDEDSHAPLVYYRQPDSSADRKCYMDIESKKEVTTNWIYGPSALDFERSYIVLNPFNASYKDQEIKENGFEDVRMDFFEESYRHGQDRAVQMILKKYPRIGSYHS